METIKLKREAGELRTVAQKELDELKEFAERQISDTLKDGESRLTAEEIAEKRGAIQGKFNEAMEIEKLVDFDDLMARPAEQMSGGAAGLKEVINALRGDKDAGPQSVSGFPSLGGFLRGVRSLGGEFEGQTERLSKEQMVSLRKLHSLATAYQRGDTDVNLAEKTLFGAPSMPGSDEGGKRAYEGLEGKALVGDDNTSAGRGDYLVPTEHMAELLKVMGEVQQFANRARRIPMSRRTLDFPRLAQTTVADTRPLFSFAAVTKIGEGVQKPEREPTFEQLLLTAIKYAAYLEASDELLSDSIVSLPPVLIQLLTEAIGYEFDRDTMRGVGTTEPQGFIGSTAEFVVNRITASQIALGDIWAMESRFFGGNPMYLYHPSTIPQLYALQASNIIVWNPNVATNAPATLLGHPLVSSHKLPLLGAKGDICLVDPMFYLVGDLQRITVMNSIHFKFRNDITAWRATFRAAGTPWPAAPFSHESSGAAFTYRVSPFVVLGVPATS